MQFLPRDALVSANAVLFTNITMTLFTVLLFCACCYFVVYICTWTLFSLYARPYFLRFM